MRIEGIPMLTLDPRVEGVLASYERRQAEEDRECARLSPGEIGRRRDDLLVSVGRATGVLLHLLAREAAARAILELGTSAGYSTLWLAAAARATGGRVVTVDCVPSKQSEAAAALDRAGLLDYVQFTLGDALAYLETTAECYDFVLLDLWKDAYIPCVRALLPRLALGATVVADNMLKPEMVRLAGAKYQAYVRTIPHMQTVLLSVGSGIAVSRYAADCSLLTP